ncbi:MAG: vitamin K epoxide reductase family protein [Anaerolineales bacterium]|nr:vitamin K epoxide reductase family protein [Anaerolineales bacterium]
MKEKHPSEPIWLVSVLLVLTGAVDSAYLAFLKFTGTVAACSNIGDCEAVNNSKYAEIGGIPLALLGLLGYLAILAFLVLETRFPSWKEGLHLSIFGFTLAGTIYSAYLTYIEIAVLHAICPYCVVSAVVMLLLFVISIMRLRRLEYVH